MFLDKLTNKFDFIEIEFLAWDKMTQFEDDDFVFVILFFNWNIIYCILNYLVS